MPSFDTYVHDCCVWSKQLQHSSPVQKLCLKSALFLASAADLRTSNSSSNPASPPCFDEDCRFKVAHDKTLRSPLQYAFTSSSYKKKKADQLQYSAARFPSEYASTSPFSIWIQVKRLLQKLNDDKERCFFFFVCEMRVWNVYNFSHLPFLSLFSLLECIFYKPRQLHHSPEGAVLLCNIHTALSAPKHFSTCSLSEDRRAT